MMIAGLFLLLSLFPVHPPCTLSYKPEIPHCDSIRPFVPIDHARPDTVDITFLGDVMMHEAQIESAYRDGRYDFSGYFDNIGGLVSGSDLTVANMEFPVGVEPYTGYPCFSAPYGILEEAASQGIDIMLSANNHICDKGAKGIKSTLDSFQRLNEEYGTLNTGVYRDQEAQEEAYPLIIEKNGIRIALLNFTYGTNGIPVPAPYRVNGTDTLELKAALEKAASDSADIIIALPHWGTEYSPVHDRHQERLASWLMENGADAIIGTHPHTPQDCSLIDGKPVIYSLGNYISNMSLNGTQIGLAATVRIVRRHGHEAAIKSVSLEYLWSSRAGFKEKGFTTVIIDEMEGKRDEWLNAHDYDRMMSARKKAEKTAGTAENILLKLQE